MCAQFSNDAKGITYLSNDAGVVVFKRPEIRASGVILASAVTATPNWPQNAGNALDLFVTVASGTGALTMPSGNSTATTGLRKGKR